MTARVLLAPLSALALLASCGDASDAGAPTQQPAAPATTTADRGELLYIVYGEATTAAFITMANGTDTFDQEDVRLTWRLTSEPAPGATTVSLRGSTRPVRSRAA